MKKKVSFSLLVVSVFPILVYMLLVKMYNSENQLSSIYLINVEALSNGESVDHYWCCGLTEDCAIGENVVIKGRFSEKPCE